MRNVTAICCTNGDECWIPFDRKDRFSELGMIFSTIVCNGGGVGLYPDLDVSREEEAVESVIEVMWKDDSGIGSDTMDPTKPIFTSHL